MFFIIVSQYVLNQYFSLQDKISKNRFWPMEIGRTPQAPPKAAKGKGGDDDAHVTFHGVVYINMAPLLYPGVKRIRGAYRVHPYLESEVLEKVKYSLFHFYVYIFEFTVVDVLRVFLSD